MLDMPPLRHADLPGLRMGYYEAGPADDPTPLVLLHGWPELAFCWRHQIKALRGSRAAASSRPTSAAMARRRGRSRSRTTISSTSPATSRICSIILKIDKAIIVGHDWGGIVGWGFPLRHPDRAAGVVGVNTPHLPRPPVDPIAIFRQRFGDSMYIVRFQDPAREPDRIFAENVEKLFDFMLRKPPPARGARRRRSTSISRPSSPTTIPPATRGRRSSAREEKAVFVETFRRTGFTGGINWYRNFTRNWERSAELDHTIRVPCLMISAELDAVLPPAMSAGMETLDPRSRTPSRQGQRPLDAAGVSRRGEPDHPRLARAPLSLRRNRPGWERPLIAPALRCGVRCGEFGRGGKHSHLLEGLSAARAGRHSRAARHRRARRGDAAVSTRSTARSKQRIHYLKVAAGDKKVANDDIVMGYEVEPGNYVLLEKDELDAVRLETRHTIELTQFVDAARHRPALFRAPLLSAARRRRRRGRLSRHPRRAARGAQGRRSASSRCAAAKTSSRSTPAARAWCSTPCATTARSATPTKCSRRSARQKPRADMLDMAKQLIESRSQAFDPSEFKNHYAEALRDLVKRKVASGGSSPVEDEAAPGAKVIDFMEALKRSLRAAARNAADEPSRSAARRSASRRRRSARAPQGGEGGGRSARPG